MSHKYFRSMIVLGFVACFLCANAKVLADTVELISGQIIEGKVISVDSKMVKINTKPDKYVVNRDQVVKITFDNKENKSTVAKKPEKIKPEVIEQPIKPKVAVISPTATGEESPQKVNQKKPDKKTDKKNSDDKNNKQKPEKTSGQPEKQNKPEKNTTQPEKQSAEKIVEKKTKPEPSKEVKASEKQTGPETANIKVNEPPKTAHMITPKIKFSKPEKVPCIDYITYVTGSSSQKTYLGIYSNAPEASNVTIYLPDKTPEKLSFKIHAQKNGKIPPLYTAGSIVFVDKNGNVISKTNPVVVDNENFVEWFKNLENIAGITGDKVVDVSIPQGTSIIKIVGYRPGSKNNLVGYISDIKLNNELLKTLNASLN